MKISNKPLEGTGMVSLRTRKRLVERLTEQGIDDIRVLEAILDIPRHKFIDEALSSRAYDDLALPIGHSQTISQPYIVAKMTEELIKHEKFSQKPLNNVLEIGTGCGYQTAILSRFSKNITTIERIKSLQNNAKKNLKELSIHNVKYINDDLSSIYGKNYKFDSILSAAAPKEVPLELKSLLHSGGKLIIPVGKENQQLLTLITRNSETDFSEKVIEKVFFVPLLSGVVS